MTIEIPDRAPTAHVIVVGNEKGGSGKSTVAMHLAIALLKQGQRVATIDLDARQRSLTNYVENRRAWVRHIARDLESPAHVCLGDKVDIADGDAAARVLADAIDTLAGNNDYIIIDTPGHDSLLTRVVHALANTLITPMNDSFVDFDVLGTVDPATFGVTGSGHYARMVQESLGQRESFGQPSTNWIVLRNRVSMLGSRNKRLVEEGLQELSRRLGFRYVEGLAERLIFREFYPRGLTAMDDLDARTLGTRPTLSHATARMEVESLLSAIGLVDASAGDEADAEKRDAA